MAAYIPVPRDLTRVKSKVFFNLTKRQLICFSLAALIGVPFFFLVKRSGNVSLAAMCMIVLSLFAMSLSKYSRCGIKPSFAELQITFVICPSEFFCVLFSKIVDNEISFHGSPNPGNRSFGRFSRPLLEGYFSN